MRDRTGVPLAAGLFAFLVSAGCLGTTAPPAAVGPDLIDVREVRTLEWSSTAVLGGAGIRLDMFNVSPFQRCDIVLALGGFLLPGHQIQGIGLSYKDGVPVGFGGGYGGGGTVQAGGIRPPQPGSTPEGGPFGPPSQITQAINITKETFGKRNLTGHVGFAVALPDVRPTDRRDDVYMQMGGRSAWVHMDCDQPADVRVYASRQTWLVTESEFDSTTRVNLPLMSGGVTRDAHSHREFHGDVVDFAAQQEGTLEFAPGNRLTIEHPEGEQSWTLGTAKSEHFFTGTSGAYDFRLDRVSAATQPMIASPNCFGLVCRPSAVMILAAIGWTEVSNFETFANLPS